MAGVEEVTDGDVPVEAAKLFVLLVEEALSACHAVKVALLLVALFFLLFCFFFEAAAIFGIDKWADDFVSDKEEADDGACVENGGDDGVCVHSE